MSENTQAKLQQALALHQAGQLAQANTIYQDILKVEPRNFDCLNLSGVIAIQTGEFEAGVKLLDRAIAVNPGVASAYNNRGYALRELKRLQEALASFDDALRLKPDYVDALNNRGNVLRDLKRLAEALENYDQALRLSPDYADAYLNRGAALYDLKRFAEALFSYDQALSLGLNDPEIYNNRGNILCKLRRLDEALIDFDKALSLKLTHADAHNNRGNVLLELGRFDEALVSYDRSLIIKPNADVYNNRGNVLRVLKRSKQALFNFDDALALNPNHADAYCNRGYVLQDINHIDEASACFDKALKLNPDREFLLGASLHARARLCAWDGLDAGLDRLATSISEFKKVTTPWAALSLLDAPALQKIAAQVYFEAEHPKSNALGPIGKRVESGKIRIGYYSADFHQHATAYLMAQLLEAHDHERFEIYGFSFGPDTKDDMQKRVSATFDKFLDVRTQSDRAIAQLSRTLGIDIAVDLKGETDDARTGIFAEGCAPIQVSYLGYPGTMGTNYIDYIIADKIVIPPEEQSAFTEKVVYLPHSYQANDATRKISDRVFTRRELGLPETGFVFCCFNNSYKILPATFDGWVNILKAVPNSVLWLLEDTATAANNLRKEAAARGVDAGRLFFAKRMPFDEHLARQRQADLFLDTLPCCAHTTASDALWAGLPVLTHLGKALAGRVAASLLNAVGLPELIAATQAEYEAKAIEFATQPEKLHQLKNRLKSNRATSPLFDGRLLAGHIEAAYVAMYARYKADLPPDVIEISP